MTGRRLTIAPLLVIMLLSLAACAVGESNTTPADSLQTVCLEPRQQICTMDYTPVCAELESEELKTYSNACTACADVSVVSHQPAACE